MKNSGWEGGIDCTTVDAWHFIATIKTLENRLQPPVFNAAR
jgi:hypothetical protein